MLEPSRRSTAVLAALVVLLVGALGVTLPRALAYDALLEENLAIKAHLQEVDRKMAEVDRILLRLRLYDAQLKSLGTPTGDHGPLPPDAFANHRLLEAHEVAEGLGDGPPMEEDDLVAPSDLRPAEAWAIAVQARADTFLDLAAASEPDLNALVEELEDLRAIEAALPSDWPAEGELTSGYGWRRNPMGRRYWKFHSGIDIANRRGAPIHAPAAGKVIHAGYTGGYGNYVEIDHGFGIVTTYGHCTTLHVKKGDAVQRGDFIATIGSTGRSTGPHLHFEVRLDDHAVDPLDYLPR